MAPHSTDSDPNIPEVINADLMQNKATLIAPIILFECVCVCVCVCNSSLYRHSLLLYIVTFLETFPAGRHLFSITHCYNEGLH